MGAPLGTRCRLCLWTARALADRARAGVPCGSPFDPPIWRVDLACGFQILATNLHWPAAPDDVLWSLIQTHCWTGHSRGRQARRMLGWGDDPASLSGWCPWAPAVPVDPLGKF